MMDHLIEDVPGKSVTIVRSTREDVSPPPYIPATSSTPVEESSAQDLYTGNVVISGIMNEKPQTMGVPQGSNMASPPTYPGSSATEPTITTHYFGNAKPPPSERTCCGCMTLRNAAICITLGKAVICIIALVQLGMLANDKRWDDLLSLDYEEVRFLRNLLVASLILESVLLLGNLIGLFGALQKHEMPILICIIANIVISIIVVILTNIIEPWSSFSLESLFGAAWEIYLFYILIRYYIFLKATRAANRRS